MLAVMTMRGLLSKPVLILCLSTADLLPGVSGFLPPSSLLQQHGVYVRSGSFDTRSILSSPFIVANFKYTPQSTVVVSPKLLSSTSSTISGSDDGEMITSQQQTGTTPTPSRLDSVLSDCTNAFPLWVVAAAAVGALRPSWLQWVNTGSLIPFLLATVMLGTGMTLQLSDFTSILQDKSSRTIVPVGVLLQYTIMPLAAYAVASWYFPIPAITSSTVTTSANAALFLGLLLVGCAPGGTASNLVSLIAKANVALSVLLTACSTVLATFITPGWVQFLFARANGVVSTGKTASTVAAAVTTGRIHISAMALMGATSRVVLLPVILGMWWNMNFPDKSKAVSRFTPFLSVLIVSLICGGVVANNRTTLLVSSAATSSLSLSLLWRIWSAVITLHSLGFGLGYFIPKVLGGYSEQTCRTLSIEVGMQNSALAVVLAKSCFGSRGGEALALAALPGALSATTHSCLGSLLAAFWRLTTPLATPSSSTSDPFDNLPATDYEI